MLVAGAGISGRAAAEALLRWGARVTVTDARPEALVDLPEGAVARAGGAAVRRGARRHRARTATRRPARGGRAGAGGGGAGAGVVDRAGPAPPAPWLAVTGTNGKTTTVGMLEAILRAAGRDTVACGNVGHPVVTAVGEGRDVLAVELSSFQLHWSPSVRAGRGVRAERRRGPPRLARLDGRLRRRQGAGAARRRSRSAGSTTRPRRRCWPPRPRRRGSVSRSPRRVPTSSASSTARSSTGPSAAARWPTSRPSRRGARRASPTRWPPRRWPAPTAYRPRPSPPGSRRSGRADIAAPSWAASTGSPTSTTRRRPTRTPRPPPSPQPQHR